MTKYSEKYRTAPVSTPGMPGGIPYIIGNEAAERFSFYGMRTILTIFMIRYLHLMGDSAQTVMSDAEASKHFHTFVGWVYLFPIAGALLADIFTGKYRTIILLSTVYCMGHLCLALMGWFGSAGMWLFAGLFLISVGSGGIKPCVSAHVGDQFGKTNSHLISRVFNYFYFSINFGAFISTLLTPWLLEWYGPHFAFGVPGVLMALATIVFWMGRNKFIHIQARGVPVILKAIRIWKSDGVAALCRRVFTRGRFRAIWGGILIILKLLVIYIFVAVFWALFDQTGSSWVLQAEDMDRTWLGVTWLSSQIQAINPIMILTFIPLFTFVVYPAIHRVFPLTPLRKISIGLFVTVGSFAIIALSQEWIDAGERPSIVWQILAYAIITAGEVMVSIVCLEFSYTQAPRTMKSVIMAFFLMSVTIGNFFTAGVNRFIQVPNTLAEIDAAADPAPFLQIEKQGDRTTKTHAGFDGRIGTGDDIAAIYENGKRVSIEFEGKEMIAAAVDRIEAHARANGWTLPLTEAGQSLIESGAAPEGPALRYRLVNSLQFRVASDGADSLPTTPWDTGFLVTVNRAPGEADKSWFQKTLSMLAPEEPWLIARQRALGLPIADDDPDRETTATRTVFVGGLTKLEGAPYFWFFTWVMLGTAIVFVVVALLYKPREYLQEEVPDAEAIAEAEGR